MELKDIKGIGPKLNEKLKEKGIKDIPTLVYTMPQSYQVYELTGLSYEKEFNAYATVVDEVKIIKLKKNTKVSFQAMINDLSFEITLFNAVYLKKILKIGSKIVVSGRYTIEYKSILADRVFLKDEYKEGIAPLYNIDSVSNSQMQKVILEALKYFKTKDIMIDTEYFKKYGYEYGKDLLYSIHAPLNKLQAEKAKEALKYYELLAFSIKLAIVRKNVLSLRKVPKKYDINAVKDFISLAIHFELTEDQKQSVNNIFKYLGSDIPLNMLLQGDVGSGKTIVALISAYAVYTAEEQSLVMVPTEALALQHYNTFKEYLEPFGANVFLLTSSTKTSERKLIQEKITNGEASVVIGTHALLFDETPYKKLGFIICDEQHKFGVDQRKKIREKGLNPDILYMTATPIPRTLAITLFKDMTLSTIRTLPKGKGNIITKIYSYKNYLEVLSFVKSELEEKKQAYFVAPVIEENEESELNSISKVKNDLDRYFKDYKVGLLHGNMSQEDKQKVILDFLDHRIDILASTTVIEVGINNQNASVMVVIDAMQFGLSQLHQLRGRVGRGKSDGYCFLMVDKITHPSRLDILEETQDGFLISEEDLKQRGPGDFLGISQKGQLKFRFADLRYDMNILKNAVLDAQEIVDNDEKALDFYQNYLHNNNFD